jgi:hypothetical protein
MNEYEQAKWISKVCEDALSQLVGLTHNGWANWYMDLGGISRLNLYERLECRCRQLIERQL